MAFNFDECQAQTCIVKRGFLYNYYDVTPPLNQYSHILLLLHGHGDFSYGWRDVIPGLLAHHIRCIVPDMLGFGQTSKPHEVEAYRLKAMSEDMSELLKHAGVIGRKVVVAGHDWGSQLASRLTLHHPSLVSACVSITGMYIPPMPSPLTLGAFTDMFPNFSYWHFFVSPQCQILLRTRMPVFFNAAIRTGREVALSMSEVEQRISTEDALTPEHWKVRPALWDENTLTRYTHTYMRGGWEAPMNWYRAFFANYEDEKHFVADPRIHVPFLTILADNDPAVPSERGEDSMPLLSNGKLVIMPCGHWIGQEDGQGLARIITKWLDDTSQ